MQLWLHSICELQLLMVKLSSPEEMKGYLLNAYHCWALLVGHLSCYKQFFFCLMDVINANYSVTTVADQIHSILNQKRKGRFQDALKGSEYFSPTRTCFQPLSLKGCTNRKYIFNLFTTGHRHCFVESLL